jgi:hypothetical protein
MAPLLLSLHTVDHFITQYIVNNVTTVALSCELLAVCATRDVASHNFFSKIQIHANINSVCVTLK